MRKFMVCKEYQEENIVLPTRSTKKSAGYDFRCLEAFQIEPGKTYLVKTGVKAMMDDDDVLLIFPRSSLAVKKGLRLTNSVAVIDADYFGNEKNDGEIMISLFNFTDQAVSIDANERIAQGIFVKYGTVEDDEAEGERKGGYGSTGTK